MKKMLKKTYSGSSKAAGDVSVIKNDNNVVNVKNQDRSTEKGIDIMKKMLKKNAAGKHKVVGDDVTPPVLEKKRD